MIAAELLIQELLSRKNRGIPVEKLIAVSSRFCGPLNHFRNISELRNLTIPTAACETEALPVVLFNRIFGCYDFVFEFLRLFPQPPMLQLPLYSGTQEIVNKEFIDGIRRLDQRIMLWVINSDRKRLDRQPYVDPKLSNTI